MRVNLLLLLLLLLLLCCAAPTLGRVVRDKDKADQKAAAHGAVTMLGEASAELQSNRIDVRYTLIKARTGALKSLKLTAECNNFRDSMYLAIGFNAGGAMVPSLTLAGWMTRTDDHDDTPAAQCQAFWMSKQADDGIAPLGLDNTAIDRCTMQRGYGSVALQIDVDLATNARLADELKAGNASASAVALPIDADGTRLIYAIGFSKPSNPMPLSFHNENYGSLPIPFHEAKHEAVPFVAASFNAALYAHMLAMLAFAFVALARLMKPAHTVEPTFMSHYVVRGLALLGVALSAYNTQTAHREHFDDAHGRVGGTIVVLTLLGPWMWRTLLSLHSSVALLALLLVLAQLALGFYKMESLWLFLGVSTAAVVLLLLTESHFANGWSQFASRKKALHI
jgi:hypothetical protein